MVSHGTSLYTFSPKSRRRGKAQRYSLVHWGYRLLLLVTLGLFFWGLGYLGFEYYQLRQLKGEIRALSAQNSRLEALYGKLTSKEVVYAKAKALGLWEPKAEQIVRLKK